MDRAELEALDRESLVARATAAGIRRARILTRPELVDELLRLDPTIDEASLRRSRGFFGRARDLLTRVVERGLHLPDAADRLRGALGPPLPDVPRPEPEAVPTVTLAEIYAAQGHDARAIETLERVLDREPEHGVARALLDRLRATAPRAQAPQVEPSAADAPAYEASAEPEPVTEAASECVAIPGRDGRIYVWWRVPRTIRGTFVVRALVFTPSWDGPIEEVRDVTPDPEEGETILLAIPSPAVVRVAVGLDHDGEFVPLAHSPALETSPAGGGALVRWTLDGAVPIALDDPGSASIARAVDGARRAFGAAHAIR